MSMTMGPGSFNSICEQAGVKLGEHGRPNVLHVDPTRFQRDAARLIHRNVSGTNSAEVFLEGVQEYLEESEQLRMCLVPITGHMDKGSSFSLGESLIRMLLSIDVIQPGLMEALLDRILNYLTEDEMDSPIPKLILQQLKWLNNIIDPAQLSAKLLEVIGISPVSIQRDIIVALPEIVPDSEHKTVVLGIVELMQTSSDLMVPILDALSNLNLQSDMLANARSHVMDKLESAELDDLPIVIKFLLQTVEPDTVENVIETIRSNLDFRSINKLQRNPNQKAKRKTANQTPEVLILDALKTGIRFQKFVTDAWYKALVAIPKASQHKVIDVMVIFILHSIVTLKKKVETMIRKKIIEGLLTKKLLEETILVHGESMREYMPAVLFISENLLRSSLNHPIVARTASALYTSAFQVSDAYYRQEIVGSLLVHIGSGSTVEIDASLAVLQNIVNASRAILNEYSAFIKGVLDYLDNLSLEQIRLFFIVLGSLAREDEISGNSGSLLTDLNITIRKQLSNPMENFKKIGVMGAIAMVQAFGIKETTAVGQGSSSQAVLSRDQAATDPLLKISVLYLNMVKDSCQKSATCLALMYDELASMVSSRLLDPKLEIWIKEEFSDQFAGTFVCDAEDEFRLRPTRNITMERWLNLDGPDAELSIKIMPSLCADLSADLSQGTHIDTPDSTVYMCSLFKLLQSTEKATGDNGLDDIDGLLGCSITMFKQEYLEDIVQMYSVEICHTAAQALLSAINWFRELTNAFSYDAGDQTMARIILRLQHISEMEVMLKQLLPSIPGFKPLEASNVKTKEIVSARGITSFAGGVSIQSTTAAGKQSTRVMQDTTLSTVKPFVVHSNEIVTFESLAPYLRELEIDIFHVLKVHEPIMRELFEITQRNEGEKVQLRFQELRFLLKDLLAKILVKLPSPVVHTPFAKKASPASTMSNNSLLVRMNTMDFVRGILKIVPHVVTKTRLMLDLLFNDDDEAMDQHGEPIDKAIVLECAGISLKVLHALLSWNELKGSDQKEIRLELLKSLALDLKSPQEVQQITESINLSVVAVDSFKNLAAWHEMMPNFENAALLVELLDKVLDLVPKTKETSVKASSVATRILSERWPASNVIKNDRLAYVLGQQIGKSDVGLKMVNEYVTRVLPSFMDQDEDISELHPMLTTATFTTFTKVLYIQLSNLVAEFEEDTFEDTKTAFEHVSDLTLCFQRLAAFVKSNDKRDVLAVTLRHSKIFMDQFMKRVLPFMGRHFRGYQDTVAKIFKNHLQAATRSLQNVCGHAKASREQTLMAMVPAIKKSMESLIFEVKLMLENNDAGAAFWLGNLKHRNLAGEEISSQLPNMSEDEEELAVEDEIEDVEMSDGEGGPPSPPPPPPVATKSSKKRPRSTAEKGQKISSVSKRAQDGKKGLVVYGGARADAASKNRRVPRIRANLRLAPAEVEEPEFRTRSQITNSDVSSGDEEDEGQDQLAGDEDGQEEEQVEDEEEEEEEEETEDEDTDRMIERKDEKLERRRRQRNPFIDDAAQDDDDDDEEDEEEEEEDDEEEDDEEEEEDDDEEE